MWGVQMNGRIETKIRTVKNQASWVAMNQVTWNGEELINLTRENETRGGIEETSWMKENWRIEFEVE